MISFFKSVIAKVSNLTYQIYKNLTTGSLSIREKNSGLVVGYAVSVMMTNVTTTVNQKVREQILREKKKYVHAFVEGQIVDVFGFISREGRSVILVNNEKDLHELGIFKKGVQATYNPYKHDSFVIRGTFPTQPVKKNYPLAVIDYINGVRLYE